MWSSTLDVYGYGKAVTVGDGHDFRAFATLCFSNLGTPFLAGAKLPSIKASISPVVIKRSLSPDGRIDSISIEFSSVVDDSAVTEIKSRVKTLKLQTEIVESFLGSAKPNGRGNGAARPNGDRNTNGTVAARMLDVGIAQTAYGERLFLDGRRARFFG